VNATLTFTAVHLPWRQNELSFMEPVTKKTTSSINRWLAMETAKPSTQWRVVMVTTAKLQKLDRAGYIQKHMRKYLNLEARTKGKLAEKSIGGHGRLSDEEN